MLGMAFFKSLIKEYGKTFFEPIGKAFQAAGLKNPNPLNPAPHTWACAERSGLTWPGRGGQATRCWVAARMGMAGMVTMSPSSSLAARSIGDMIRIEAWGSAALMRSMTTE